MIFIREFFKNIKQTGAIIPSSRFLANSIVSEINYNSADYIIELGAGTGIFTKKIIDNLSNDTKLFIFEINPYFYKILQNKFSHIKNVYILNESAENIKTILSIYKVSKVDYIVSGLPLLNFSYDLRKVIFKNISECLKGKLILFQYTNILESEINCLYKIERIKRVFLNFPPAKIYCLRNNT